MSTKYAIWGLKTLDAIIPCNITDSNKNVTLLGGLNDRKYLAESVRLYKNGGYSGFDETIVAVAIVKTKTVESNISGLMDTVSDGEPEIIKLSDLLKY